MVVVLPATNDMCMIRKPSTLKANAMFKTEWIGQQYLEVREKTIKLIKEKVVKTSPKVRNVAAMVPGVPGISSSEKNAMK